MRIHPVPLPELIDGEVVVVGDEAHHLIRVLGVRTGARLRAFDGRGREAGADVLGVEAGRLTVRLEAPTPGRREPRRRLTLIAALLKGDKLADVVRMATELGVVRIRTLRTRRCEVSAPSANRFERLARVAREAAKQSGRSVVPAVEAPVALERLGPPTADTVVADPDADTALADLGPSVALITGPEGGFDPGEVATLAATGWRPVGLGGAEKAPVAASALLLLGGAG